jgi:hypothetical protein
MSWCFSITHKTFILCIFGIVYKRGIGTKVRITQEYFRWLYSTLIQCGSLSTRMKCNISWQLVVPQLLKDFSAFHETLMFTTVLA